PAEEPRDDDQRRGGRRRGGTGQNEHGRGERCDRQEHVDVVDEVPDHSGAQGGPPGRWQGGGDEGDGSGGRGAHRPVPTGAVRGEASAPRVGRSRNACSKNSSSWREASRWARAASARTSGLAAASSRSTTSSAPATPATNPGSR